MFKHLARAAVIAATALAVVAPSTGSASAASPCTDPVVEALHTVHDATGDPAGAVHLAEDTYCDAKP